MFYNSTNYGGILQAYALTNYLNRCGYDAEQICYNMWSAYNLNRRLKRIIKKIYLIITDLRAFNTNINILKRNRIIKNNALKLVRHSSKVYSEGNIYKCLNNYSKFITGSDQVWHGEWPAFFLNFVTGSKKKIAYAISTGKSSFTYSELKKIKEYSQDFTAISVRESDVLDTFKKNLNNEQIELTLDPTLLLSYNDWDAVTSSRKVDCKYLFCYYLGSDIRLRNIAKQYAKVNNLLIVTIPHMQQHIEPSDVGFGDLQVFDASPQDFLSYIKFADAVFTDSFHASVFSNIFKVQYYVFSRAGHQEMDNRIKTLTNMLNSSSHFIDNEINYNIEYIHSLKAIDFFKEQEQLLDMQEKSEKFIINAIS